MPNNADFEFGALIEAVNYRQALIADFSENLHGKVIEIGAGIGQLTAELRKMKSISLLQCIEPEKNYCKRIQEKFPEQSLICGTVFDENRADWDAIVSVNVLEHIENDERELTEYFSKLKQKHGTLNLFIPARPELYAPIDKIFGHYRRYTIDEIRNKLLKVGFKIEKIRYYNFLGYFIWAWNFKLMKSVTFRPFMVKVFDRLIFPVIHVIERYISPPLGQSIQVIARAS